MPLQGTISRFERKRDTGEIVGATMRLENGLSGFIFRGNVSDAPFADIEERLEVGQMVKARVLEFGKAGCLEAMRAPLPGVSHFFSN